MKETVVNIMENIWPMIFIVAIIAVTTRVTYLIISRKNFVIYDELLSLSFIIYILLLFYIVTFQDVNYGNNNYTPFKEMFRYNFGTELFFKNVIGNILLFVPFGLYITHYIKTKKYFPIFIISVIVSISIEITQMLIGRVFDIDDIMLNILGGFLGYLIYRFLKSIFNKLPRIFRSNLFMNLLMIVIAILLILKFTNFTFWGIIK